MKTKTFLKTLLIGLVFTFLGCTEETIINNIVDDTDGKVNIYIEGNITNAEAQAKLQAQIGTQTENIYVQNTTQLTEIIINVSIATNFRDVVIIENSLLKDILINGTNNKINAIEINDTNELENITINGIIMANNLKVSTHSNENAIHLICNDLTTLNKYLEINLEGQNSIASFNHLRNINCILKEELRRSLIVGYIIELNLPELEEVHNFALGIRNLENIFLPKLTKANEFYISHLKNLNLPLLNYCKYFSIYKTNYADGSTTNLNFPNLNYCYSFTAHWTNLTSNQINQILDKFLNIQPLSDKFIDLGGNNNAPPTGQGLVDKATLIIQGNTVYTN